MAELFRTAESNNATLAAFRAATAEAKAAIRAAKADRLPEIQAKAAVSYLGNGRTWNRQFGESASVPIPHFGNNFALRVSQTVYTGGAMSAGIRLKEQAAEMSRLSAQEQEQHVRFLIAGLYLQLHSLYNEEVVLDANAKLAADLIEKMKKRREEGIALRNDVTRYELQHEQILLRKTQTKHQRLIVERQLQTALGTESAVPLLPVSAFSETELAVTGEEEWQQLAETSHTSLQKSRLSISMNRTREKLERAAMLPKIGFIAEDNLNGPVTIEVPALNKNFNYWFVGVGVSYNFSSLYKNDRRLRQAKLATATAKSAHEAALKNVGDRVQQAYVNLLTAQSDLRTHTKNVELATGNYSIVSNRYTNGLALVTDLTDAANVKLNAELALANARINAVYARYALKYASGNL